MHNDFGHHLGQEEVEQSEGEAKASPIVTVLHHLQAVTVELDITVKVHLEEGPHGDLVLAAVLHTIRLLLEGKVVLHRTSRVSGLLILAGSKSGGSVPEGGEDWDGGEDGKEYCGLQSSANLPGEVERDKTQQREEEDVGEALGARGISGERRILD